MNVCCWYVNMEGKDHNHIQYEDYIYLKLLNFSFMIIRCTNGKSGVYEMRQPDSFNYVSYIVGMLDNEYCKSVMKKVLNFYARKNSNKFP